MDEYENLEGYQQSVVNTLIKHCGGLYSFKVGVKELGVKERSTLNDSEELVHPADYRRINISDELTRGDFGRFAADVCRSRLQEAVGSGESVPGMPEVFPGVTAEKEAELLGVSGALEKAVRESSVTESAVGDFEEWRRSVEILEAYTLVVRAGAEGKTLDEKLAEARANPRRWRQQYENYRHSYLFTIKRGKRGIRKHYAGWDTLCRLAASNVRYMLELVERALERNLDDGGGPLGPVSAEVQTKAAQYVGKARLREVGRARTRWRAADAASFGVGTGFPDNGGGHHRAHSGGESVLFEFKNRK